MTLHLFRKFRYQVTDRERDVIEQHYSDYFLNIGYRGQIYFITVEQVDVAEVVCYADLLWRTPF